MPRNQWITLRSSPAATWTSVNPTLAAGELGYETDTGKFKLGDSTTAWTSLPYGGLYGPQATSIIENFGDMSDGNVTVSSGTTTLTRDMYYNNLTFTGGQIVTNGYRIFVAGILDITNATAASIINNGGNGSGATSQLGGAIGTVTTANTIGAGTVGTAGATGNTGAGVTASAVAAGGQNGGSSNSAGASGAGGTNASSTAGAVGQSGSPVVNAFPVRRFETELISGATIIKGGSGGAGGSAGSGDGTTNGNTCGGGGGGAGGGVVGIWANTIARGSSTAVSSIQAKGGNGGNGRNGLGTYTFTISTGSTASIGDTYTNNGQTFTVTTALLSSATSFVTKISTSGVPTNTGTLTRTSGTGSSTVIYTAVASTSSAAAVTAGIGGAGGAAAGGGGWIYIQYSNLTGSTATNCLDASGGNGGVSGNGANNYTFTVTAGQTASVGATFTNNGQAFYVTTALTSAQTTLITIGTGAPSASGTLTKANGTSSNNVTFSSSTSGTHGVGGTGGSGGDGGRITLLQVPSSLGSDTFTGSGGTGGSPSGVFGGTMGVGGNNKVSI